ASPIGEDDIYMQIRAGSEILYGGHFSFPDTWSFTEQGTMWTNYYWLPTVVFKLVYDLGGDPALVLLRICLVFLLAMGLGLLASRVIGASSKIPYFSVVPLVFLIIAPRMQLRPETFGFVCFVYLLLAWTTNNTRRVWLTPLIIWIWANIHSGT